MGKASKRKKRGFENRDAQGSDFGEVVLHSIFTRYGFLITLFLITVSAFLIYSNTFSSPFHFDDTPNIVENYKLRDLSNFWPPSGARYIGFLSFAINYHFGSLNVFSYHLVNIIIHIINSILVWWLVVLTFRTPVMERINTNPQLRYFIAITASLIFVSHPVQTQAVTYIVQRFASLSTLFYLLSLTLYIKARLIPLSPPLEKGEEKTFPPLKKGGKGGFLTFYLASLLSAILAMKTKEIGFTLPFVVVLYEFMFFSHASATPVSSTGQALKGCPTGKETIVGQDFSPAKRIAYLIPFLLTLLIIPLSLIGTDKPVGDIIGELREAAQETEEIPRNIYLLTQFRVIVTYIRLLFLPINQNLDYDYPLSHSLFEPATFLSFIFLSAIFIFAVYLFIRSRKMVTGHCEGHSPEAISVLTSFGLLWFFITLSVESSIIPIRDVIFEHRLYLPSVGIIIAFSSGVLYGVNYARERLDIKISLLVATCILLLVTAFPLGVAAYKRNFVWRDEITLWEDAVGKSPNKAGGYINLGIAYDNRGQINEAIEKYKKALMLKPAFAEVHNNLGNVYDKVGQTNEAIEEYKLALQLKPNYAETHYNLGIIYNNQSKINEAIEEYKLALRSKPDYPEAHNNLGNVYLNLGQIDNAIEEYSLTLRLKPDYAEAHNNLGNAYGSKGSLDMAIKEFRMAIHYKSDYAEAHFGLGIAYKEKGLKNEAIREFESGLKIKPNDIMARKVLESLSK